jgi:hypothetical protein
MWISWPLAVALILGVAAVHVGFVFPSVDGAIQVLADFNAKLTRFSELYLTVRHWWLDEGGWKVACVLAAVVPLLVPMVFRRCAAANKFQWAISIGFPVLMLNIVMMSTAVAVNQPLFRILDKISGRHALR